MIDIFVNSNKLTIKQPIVASDTIESMECAVHYEDSYWDDCTNIYAYISNGTEMYSIPVVDGVISPAVEPSVGTWTIYLVGEDAQGHRVATNADTLFITAPGGVKGYPYVKIPFDISYQSYLIAKNAEYIASNASGGGGGSLLGDGGCKLIGFTEGCDYVATAEDGYTAFAVAMSEAEDGDTILVMQGTYKGEREFILEKNINFIGLGKPEIDFPVRIQGGGIFDYELWDWAEIYPNITSAWNGFKFLKTFRVGCMNKADEELRYGRAFMTDCDFTASAYVNGEFTRCSFAGEYIEIGNYYGADSILTDCSIMVSSSFNSDAGFNKYRRCNIYLTDSVVLYITTYEDGNLVGCKIFAPNDTLRFGDNHGGSPLMLGDTLIFANEVTADATGTTGGYLIKGESLAGSH